MTSYDLEAARGLEKDGGFTNPTYDEGLHTTQPQPRAEVTLEVSSPSGSEVPGTHTRLVLSILSSIFCGFFCGFIAILLVLLARLKLSDRKLEHARHSLNFNRIFLYLSLLCGIISWIVIVVYIAVIIAVTVRSK